MVVVGSSINVLLHLVPLNVYVQTMFQGGLDLHEIHGNL